MIASMFPDESSTESTSVATKTRRKPAPKPAPEPKPTPPFEVPATEPTDVEPIDDAPGIESLYTPEMEDVPCEAHLAAAHHLRSECMAVRVSFSWLGTSKSIDKTTRDEMASPFKANADFLSAGKKILDNRHEKVLAVTKIRGEALKYWKDNSLPFPETGVRLIPQNRIDHFTAAMETLQSDLEAAVTALEAEYPSLIEKAKESLGTLFNASDYPQTLIGAFAIHYDFPNVEAPDYLMELRPAIYEQERARVAAQFDEAVRLAEASFLEEFSGLVSYLCTVLTAKTEDGKPKVFKDSSVSNLKEFFDRFKTLNVRSNPQLDALVDEARKALGRGVSAKTIRAEAEIREDVVKSLSKVKDQLEGMTTSAPRRRVMRNLAPKATAPETVSVSIPEDADDRPY